LRTNIKIIKYIIILITIIAFTSCGLGRQKTGVLT